MSLTGSQRTLLEKLFGPQNVPAEKTNYISTVLNNASNRTNVNQIRGINQSGAVGSGIPKHVTNVSASVSDASVGSTSKVVLTFQRDSTDKTFSGVTVFARGYQGNHSPTQVGFGTDAPITLILNNTGESVSLLVQATGNGGSAPLSTAPSCGVRLPKNTTGGFGTGTTTNLTTPQVTSTATAIVQASTKPRLTASWQVVGQYSGAIAGAGPTSNSVIVSTDFPIVGFSSGSTADNGVTGTAPKVHQVFINAGTAAHDYLGNIGTALWQTGKNIAWSWLGACSNGTNPSGGVTNTRFFTGLTDAATVSAMHGATWPTQKFACFRFDSTVDTNYMAVLSNGGGSGTAVDTGIACVDLGTHGVRLFAINFDDTNGVVKYFIDGKLVATITNSIGTGTGTFLSALHVVENLLLTKTAQAVWARMDISSDL